MILAVRALELLSGVLLGRSFIGLVLLVILLILISFVVPTKAGDPR